MEDFLTNLSASLEDFFANITSGTNVITFTVLEIIIFTSIVLAVVVFVSFVTVLFYKRKLKFFTGIQSQLLNQHNELEKQHKVLESQFAKTKGALRVVHLDDKEWRNEEMDYIFKLQEQLSLVRQLDIAARYIVESVHKFLNVNKTILILLDKNTDQLKISYALGLDKDEIDLGPLKQAESISGFVLTQNKPLLIEELKNEHYLQGINKEKYLSGDFISIPLLFEKESLGILHVCGKKTGQLLSKTELATITNMGKVAAIAMKNILLFEQINEDYLKTIAALAQAIDARDPYTKWHSENVTRYSMAIAKEMKLAYHDQEIIKRAALLHDVGKIGIRDNILLKNSSLTAEEYEQIKTHSLKGEEIVKSLSFLKEVCALIRHHHERFDGKGYPDAIAGHEIELGARIMAVADSFDAMTTDRPYRKAMAMKEATVELEKCKKIQFDPEVVDYFIKILNENPDIILRRA